MTVALAATVLTLAASPTPQAARIDSITPSSAARGDLVTITGIGFGAQNVRITVADLLAEVLAATGNTVTFRVPSGARPGATMVVATNPGGQSGSIAFTVVNRVPRANAGPDQTVFVTSTVQLDGSGSTDADGDALTFHWSFLSRPNGSNAELSDPSAVRPTFVVDLPGQYAVQLVVNDGFADSPPDTVLIDTQNSPPIANAGPDQTVFVAATVQLDGSGSSDVDGDLLSFRWSFVSRPAGSHATLTDDTAPGPAFVVDLPGRYVVQLVVNDGAVDSRPDTVTIDTRNSRPIADAGPDQTVLVGATVQLDGSGSSDVDHDLLSFRWSFLSRPDGSTTTLSDATAVNPTFVADLIGLYVVQLIANDGAVDGEPDTVVVTASQPNQPPSVSAGPDQTITLPDTATLNGSASDDGLPLGSVLTIGWSQLSGPGSVTFSNPSAAQTTAAFSAAGVYVLRLSASDGQLAASADVMVTVNPVNQAPSVDAGPDQTITLPAAATLNGTVTDDGLPPGSTLAVAWSTVSGPGTVTFTDPSAASTTATFSTNGDYVLRLTASDTLLSSSDDVMVTVNPAGGTPGLPPDPSTVAPPLNPTIAPDVRSSTEFLYTGADPIQTGVAPGTIDVRRAAVLRGKVSTRDGAPLPGVRMTVLGHPEFGQTLSRADGLFDMAVNGGGFFTVRYEKAGFLTAQRQINVPWQGFALLPDVVLVPLDSQVTPVDLSANVPIQVARGNPVTDADGTRRATLLFGQGTTATMVLPDGSTQPLTTLQVRATEYTVGPNGPAAMPGELPPTSGYTYAVELSADEALAVRAKRVAFSQPLIHYVENFLNFPVGTIVPVGFYDRDRSAWVPSDNGRVIRITGVSGGLASVDTVGAGSLPPLALSDAERQQLAALYQPGQTLWRVPIPHFTPWDCNWPYGPKPDARAPNLPNPRADNPPKRPCEQAGSIIQCESQILGETVPVTGTPFHLRYGSNRVPGRKAAFTLDIPLSGAELPGSLRRIELEVSVAGRRVAQTFPATPGQHTSFTWDGKDAYGRDLPSAAGTVRVGYVYAGVYQQPAQVAQSFALFSGIPVEGNPARLEITIWQESAHRLGTLPAQVGGWSLSPHHGYDPAGKVLYQGDGTRLDAQAIDSAVITTVAGNGTAGFSGDGGLATLARLSSPFAVAVAPDGSFYVADGGNGRIRRIGPDGVITTVAAGFVNPTGVAVAPDGSLYVADTNNQRIRRVGPGGIITTVAGNGTGGFSGDGGPATLASLRSPSAVAAAPDGSFYVADSNNDRIRRVGPDGIITTVAGNGTRAFSGDGGPATLASLAGPLGVAITPDGGLYVADAINDRIGRVGPGGIITTVAGGTNGFSGDGGPATLAGLNRPWGVAVAPDGSFYVGDRVNHRIRRVGPDRIITTVAGNGTRAFSGDGGPATLGSLNFPAGVAVAPDGSLYVADSINNRIRRVAPVLPGGSVGDSLIPSEDGNEVYRFDGSGRHLQTLHALTGAVRYQFAYASDGRLAAVTDGDGNVTAVERDASGHPIAIVAPFGQRTTLAVNGDGYLSRIANPAGEAVQATYTADGLLTSFTDPRGNVSRYTYDALGRLIRADDAAGGFKTLTRADTANGYTVALQTSLGRTTTYGVERLSTGATRRTVTDPSGARAELVIGTDGTERTTHRDGTVTMLTRGPDPRWGMLAPVALSQTLTLPSGLTRTIAGNRTVTLTNPADPFALATLNETLNVNGRTTTRSYTASTRTLVTITPTGRRVTTILDELGRIASQQAGGLNPVVISYDNRGRVATITQGGRVTTFEYGADGYLARVTDAVGRTSQYVRDPVGRIVSQTRPDGTVVGFAYDHNGNLTRLTPPGRPDHAFDYTPLDLTASYVAPGTVVTAYLYNLDRQLTREVRPDGKLIDFGYDTVGRLSTKTIDTGTITAGYDPADRLTQLTAPGDLGLTLSYDGFLPTGEAATGSLVGNIGRTYNNRLLLISRSLNGNAISQTYDADDLLTGAGGLSLVRDLQTGLVSNTALGVVTTALARNSFGEITSLHAAASFQDFYTASYERDDLGRITSLAETFSGTTTYRYDTGGRLLEVRQGGELAEQYQYDANGNRTQATVAGATVTATYDDQDGLLTYGNATFTHTAAGERLTKTVAGLTTTYAYDALGNLVGVTLPDGRQITYLVDGRNRRVGKRVDGATVQQWLYQDRLRPIAELDGSGNLVSRFVYATNLNAPDYMIRSGVTYRILTDHRGSPRLVVDAATGAIVQRMEYDSFGNVLQDTNPGFQPFGFAGGLYDRDTKLVRFGARDYDAETGRWTAKDPIRFRARDTNLYAYVRSDPVNFVDPSGLNGTVELTIGQPRITGIDLGVLNPNGELSEVEPPTVELTIGEPRITRVEPGVLNPNGELSEVKPSEVELMPLDPSKIKIREEPQVEITIDPSKIKITPCP